MASDLPCLGAMEPRLVELPRRALESALNTSVAPVELASSGPGYDQRIALALCDAQATGGPAGGRAGKGAREQTRSLQEILEMAKRHGWNHAFKTLKSEGLLREQTLGQVVARWIPRERAAETLTATPPSARLRIAPSPAPSRIG